MNRSEWERAKALLADAAELPLADRDRFVSEQCPDLALRREVLELLASPAALSGIVTGNALQPGARLGPYVIDRLIGSGGMGEVYEARDTILNRNVAIKVLPDSLAGDADRLSRFRREAQLLAALNHPNIAHIHGFEESNGAAALVMELVDGPTLGDRIARGVIPLNEALSIARQIADALDAAHEQGIVHRDLKPANIKVREDGIVKVLDFGLAKVLDSTASSGAQPLKARSAAETQPGLVLGTAAYMAPEQARGQVVDKRADIWSFGCVLYEMLTGNRAFAGDGTTDTLSLVLTREPDWTALPPDTPAPILKALRRCLEKTRQRRLADIADARLDIEEALSPSADSTAASVRGRVAPPPRWRSLLPWAVAAACGTALALVLVFGSPSRDTPPSTALRLTAELGVDAASLAPGIGSSIALSTDGAQIAFMAQRPSDNAPQLYVRRFEQSQAAVLPETDGAESPFFSPDGKWIAFFSSGKLKKISVSGGAPIALCDAPNGRGGSWGEDGTIVFSPDRQMGLWRVPASGGLPEPLTTLDAHETTQRWPQILPGGKAVLYSSLSQADDSDFDKGNLVIQPLPTGARKVVQRGGYYGRYMPSGQLVYLHNGAIFAAAFDPVHLEVTSSPVPVVESVISNTTGGAAMFAVSASGTLVYRPRGPAATLNRPIEWMDRSGKSTSLRPAPAHWTNLNFGPDGRTVAYDIFDGKQTDIWVNDWSRDRLTRLTTSTTHSMMPVWTPDGRRIAFASQRGEKAIHTTFNLYWQRADGTGDVQRLTESTNLQLPGSWHPSGKFLAFQEERSSGFNLMLLPIDGDETSGWRAGTPTVFLDSAFDQRQPTFSPDGRWIAYQSNQSGLFEVYVRPFPGPGGQWQISTGGGLFPTWSRTRRELLYSTFDQRIMVAPYAVDRNAFHPEEPRPWPEARYAFQGVEGRRFDLHPDGNRLALAVLRDSETIPKLDRLMIVLNLSDELRSRAATTNR